MVLGRLYLHLNKGFYWGRINAACGCYLFDLGPIGIVWSDKYCKCDDCGHYVCKCVCGFCNKGVVECKCEEI